MRHHAPPATGVGIRGPQDQPPRPPGGRGKPIRKDYLAGTLVLGTAGGVGVFGCSFCWQPTRARQAVISKQKAIFIVPSSESDLSPSFTPGLHPQVARFPNSDSAGCPDADPFSRGPASTAGHRVSGQRTNPSPSLSRATPLPSTKCARNAPAQPSEKLAGKGLVFSGDCPILCQKLELKPL